jgi:preprotein translocase subunit SecG
MSTVSSVLPYIQIALSVIVIASVLLQQSGAANGSALGGADMSSAFHTRRGLEKILFVTTIVASILFAVTSFLGLVL